MSGLAGFAAVLTATRALRGQTLAGGNVLMAPATAIDITAPTICVYGGHGSAKPAGRDLQAADGDLVLRIELFAPEEVALASGATALTVSNSDSGEALFGILWFQCLRAVLYSQDTWPTLFREFVPRFTQTEWRSSLFEGERGTKIVARVIELTCDLLNEPDFATAPTLSWARLLDALAAAGGESKSLAGFIAAELAATAGCAAR